MYKTVSLPESEIKKAIEDYVNKSESGTYFFRLKVGVCSPSYQLK